MPAGRWCDPYDDNADGDDNACNSPLDPRVINNNVCMEVDLTTRSDTAEIRKDMQIL